jgi:hypothetical protein
MLVQNCLAWTDVADFTNRKAVSIVRAVRAKARCEHNLDAGARCYAQDYFNRGKRRPALRRREFT